MALALEPIPADPNDPAWHEARRTFIGASDAPAVLGISPWSTPLDVWADKLNKPGQFQGNLATDMGRALEELIADKWLEGEMITKDVHNPCVTVRHPDHEHIAASVDRVVITRVAGYITDPLAAIRDGRATDLLECKYVGPTTAWQWKTGVPVYVQAQVQVQMAVTGAHRVHVCALIVDYAPEWKCWTIERDDAVIAEIIGRLNQFWDEHIETQTHPDIDGAWDAEKVRDALCRIYSKPDKGVPARLGSWATDLITDIKRSQALSKDLDEQIEKAKNELRDALGDCTDGFVDDNKKPVVTWRPQTSHRYDNSAVLAGKVDGFTDDELDIAKRVLLATETVATTRVLRIA